MGLQRRLNAELIDRKIIERGWTYSEAAARIGIAKESLSKIRNGENVNNKVILKVSKSLDIPLEQLVIWGTG